MLCHSLTSTLCEPCQVHGAVFYTFAFLCVYNCDTIISVPYESNELSHDFSPVAKHGFGF